MFIFKGQEGECYVISTYHWVDFIAFYFKRKISNNVYIKNGIYKYSTDN